MPTGGIEEELGDGVSEIRVIVDKGGVAESCEFEACIVNFSVAFNQQLSRALYIQRTSLEVGVSVLY